MKKKLIACICGASALIVGLLLSATNVFATECGGN
jgi:hypothetical protein